MVVQHFKFGTYELLRLTQVRNGILAQKMGDIHEQPTRLGIVDAIERTTLRCGDFRADSILKGSGVITQADLLCSAQLLLLSFFSHGLDEDVAIFLASTSAAHMSLREPRHPCGHGCPSRIGRHPTVRAGLHHAKRHGWPWEGAPHPLTADRWINILCMLCHCGAYHGKSHNHGNQPVFHIDYKYREKI